MSHLLANATLINAGQKV